MSKGNLSSLRFSLEESVWFQKGQEVEELVSISLDPNITIQENEQYVTIQGTLELSGEYKRYQTEETAVEEHVSSARFIHSVEEREEGICEFLHRFPVDISIPNNRIQSVYDIDVVVESFDYLFPERSCMKLTADLKISGLYGEQQKAPVSDEELNFVQDDSVRDDDNPAEEEDIAEKAVKLNEKDDIGKEIEPDKADEAFEEREEELQLLSRFSPLLDSEEEKNEENVYETFEAEARKQPEAELDLEPVKEAPPAALFELNPASESAEKAQEEAPAESGVFAPEISFSVQRKEAPAAPKAAEQFEKNQEEEIAEETETAELEVKQEQEPVIEEADESESSPDEVKTKKKKLSKEKSLSITEFLARKEEERHAKLKVCIVQQGETLDQLAERYDITISQLLRVNHLEANQDVYEGQVLYIPVAVKQKQ